MTYKLQSPRKFGVLLSFDANLEKLIILKRQLAVLLGNASKILRRNRVDSLVVDVTSYTVVVVQNLLRCIPLMNTDQAVGEATNISNPTGKAEASAANTSDSRNYTCSLYTYNGLHRWAASAARRMRPTRKLVEHR